MSDDAVMPNSPYKRVRSTSATQRRVENIQKLIGELTTREMLADEIAWFLKFTPSGTRKYIRELRDAGVIELVRYVEGTATYLGKAVYGMSPNQERVKAFLSAIALPKREGAPTGKPSLNELERNMAEAGRHFHIMADDVHYAIRMQRTRVARDPLVSALFGEPGADK